MSTVDLVAPLDNKLVNWRALEYFNLYRLLLAGIFVILSQIEQLPRPLGSLDAELFTATAYLYLLIALGLNFFIRYQYPNFDIQVIFHGLVDITIISVLMYSSNGLSSGFGTLIITAVAGASILCPGKMAIVFAAIAALAVLGHEVYFHFFIFAHLVNYTHAGILGGTLFITAIISYLLSVKIRTGEQLANRQAAAINELAKINENIIQQLKDGVILLDNQHNILLINESAKHLLQDPNFTAGARLPTLLVTEINAWLFESGPATTITKLKNNDLEVQLSFVKLKLAASDFKVLVFIEDITALKIQAQQMKLASLARLTASIAHEIRNPLGAINHASQLLLEANALAPEEKRLTQIIDDHSMRINSIIENVISISSKKQAAPERLAIAPWLKNFSHELVAKYSLPKDTIAVTELAADIHVHVDPSQLYQVLWNLSENALRYSKQFPYLSFQCGVDKRSRRAFIDIIDYGPGVPDEVKDSLFEPFFTTEKKGSGLGLYLAKELCEANQATLNFYAKPNQGALFKISFMPTD